MVYRTGGIIVRRNPDCRHVKLYGYGDISVFNIRPNI